MRDRPLEPPFYDSQIALAYYDCMIWEKERADELEADNKRLREELHEAAAALRSLNQKAEQLS